MKINKNIYIELKRNLDALGRVVIPMEMRKHLCFDKNQKVSIKLYNNHVRIEKSQEEDDDDVCCFCGIKNNLINHKDILVCTNCIDDLLDKLE